MNDKEIEEKAQIEQELRKYGYVLKFIVEDEYIYVFLNPIKIITGLKHIDYNAISFLRAYGYEVLTVFFDYIQEPYMVFFKRRDRNEL